MAILINIVGASALILWLMSGALAIPLQEKTTLWTVGLIVLLIGVAEIKTKSFFYRE